VGSDGKVTYTPTNGFSGNDSFTYHATSSNGSTAVQAVTIAVSESGAPPPAPTCHAVSASTGVGAAATIKFSCTDAGGAALTYVINTNPAHGTLSGLNQTNATVLYTPAAGFKGTDTFTYHATSVNGASTVATVTIAVGVAAAQPCTVPKLKGDSLSKARKALTKAHCKLGKVTKPKVKKGHKAPKLVVASSKPKAGTKHPAGTKVAVTLGPAPKKKPKKH
jgi:hypothetical protein